MQYGILLLTLIGIVSCTTNAHSTHLENQMISATKSATPPDSIQLDLNFTPEGDYSELLGDIKQSISAGKTSGADLEDYLLNKIIPHWYGTPWDFNGYTNVPNEGVIACGYFVSTTLKHVGFNLNRYHLAQQAGLNEAKSLALSNEKYYRTVYGKDKFLNVLNKDYTNGLYFIGLDNHVGYLYIKDKAYYFIHANYIDNKVMLEEAFSAEAFQSNVYVIAEISTNEALLERLRSGSVIPIIKG